MSSGQAKTFEQFFCAGTGFSSPYLWQTLVAKEGLPQVLVVPTGLGKTEVALAWAWHRLVANEAEPRHLVYCLPVRSLVTQTVQRLKGYFDALRTEYPTLDVAVYQLMGGTIDDEWARWPDKPWILVGTQDQLLSRALNRGYAMIRFERNRKNQTCWASRGSQEGALALGG
jgi:CRISPR-associated endonuclease/helicase Cas3